MNKLFFIGDLHGNFQHLKYLLKNVRNAYLIQVGDFQIGFGKFSEDVKILQNLNDFLRERQCILYVIRGNHDNPDFFQGTYNYDCLKLVPDYTIVNLNGWGKAMLIGGGISINRVRLKEMNAPDKLNWWPTEKVNYCVEKLAATDLNILVTHIAPNFCYPFNQNGYPQIISNWAEFDENLIADLDEERQIMTNIFNKMQENNKIKYHYYGHYHSNEVSILNGTKHTLLGVGEMVELKKEV